MIYLQVLPDEESSEEEDESFFTGNKKTEAKSDGKSGCFLTLVLLICLVIFLFT